MATQPKHLVTFEEYLDLESEAKFKSEFSAGQIFAMSGGTERHSRLSAQAVGLLLRHVDCKIYDSNLKVYVEQADQCFYPDAMALCGEPQFWKGRQEVIVNPTLVVEVLSPSTERYDRQAKATYYRSIPSLRHILLIAQDRVSIEHFSRESDQWMLTCHESTAQSISFLGATLPVADFYRGILS